VLVAVRVSGQGWLAGSATTVIRAVQLLDCMVKYPVEDGKTVANSPGGTR
jgi:hypothetical protein